MKGPSIARPDFYSWYPADNSLAHLFRVKSDTNNSPLLIYVPPSCLPRRWQAFSTGYVTVCFSNLFPGAQLASSCVKKNIDIRSTLVLSVFLVYTDLTGTIYCRGVHFTPHSFGSFARGKGFQWSPNPNSHWVCTVRPWDIFLESPLFLYDPEPRWIQPLLSYNTIGYTYIHRTL